MQISLLNDTVATSRITLPAFTVCSLGGGGGHRGQGCGERVLTPEGVGPPAPGRVPTAHPGTHSESRGRPTPPPG